ncbi:MAG: hypothetical protein AAGC77_11985 [Pseudomonadota bacterium]
MTAGHEHDAAEKPYVIISGHGRSGSNRVLDAFDCHPDTLCRNEPNEAGGDNFKELRVGFFPEGADPAFLNQWRGVIARAARETSSRDRIGARKKSYLYNLTRRMIGENIFARRRLRETLGLVSPSLRKDAWPLPAYYASPARLSQATPVLKLLLCQGWLLDAFDAEPGMRIVHNLRSPQGFLRSWRRRWADHIGAEQVFRDNLVDIDRILEHFGQATGRFGDFSEGNLFETELWRWRFVNEPLYVRFKDHPRYMPVTYESFDARPAETTERLYAFAGLALDERTRALAASLENKLFGKMTPQSSPDDSHIDEAVNTVLQDSPLAAFWPEIRMGAQTAAAHSELEARDRSAAS